MRRIVLILICALMAMSHGGLVAAHSHDDGMAAHHDNHSATYATADIADHDADHDDAAAHDDHGIAPVDGDSDRPSSNPSTIAHSHIVVDASATPPVLANVRVVTLRFEPPLRRDALPPSATIAPGLEPPDA